MQKFQAKLMNLILDALAQRIGKQNSIGLIIFTEIFLCNFNKNGIVSFKLNKTLFMLNISLPCLLNLEILRNTAACN